MKIKIQESGEKTGWYDLEEDEYNYEGKDPVIESILDKAEGFSEVKEVQIDEGEEDIVGGEVWTASSQQTKLSQIRNLLEPFDDVKVTKSSGFQVLVVEDNIVQKRRIYVDDPSDAPDWATVEEGPQEGLYYETQSSVDEGIPEFLDPSYATESEGIRESVDDRRGRYASTMQVHYMPGEDRKVYSKNAESSHMIGEFMSDSVFEAMGLEAPAVAYDPEEESIYKEGIEGSTLAQLTGNTERIVSQDRRDPDELDRDSYIEQVAAMIVTGNDDLNSGNMVADSTGEFWIVDHDNLGKRNLSYSPFEAAPIAESAINYAKNMGLEEITKSEIQEKVQDIASNAIDEDGEVSQEFIDALTEAADHPIEGDEKNVTQAIQETLQMNIKAAYNEELEWTF